jgi:hypothetical protein
MHASCSPWSAGGYCRGMICSMPKHWKQELWLFAAIAALSWLAGALSGLLLPCLLAGLLLYLGWHLYQLTGLWQRLQDNRHGC